jgi:release factor glutamine methyltransferase
VENGRLDAEFLLAHVLGVARLDLYLQFDRPLGAQELAAFKALLKRRAAREPLQYVLGRTSFRELELVTDSRALIPRPETEGLVEEVLAWFRNRPEAGTGGDGQPDSQGAWGSALDLGTGTGAIALSLLKEGEFSHVVGTDPSREALELAAENARVLSPDHPLDLREGFLFEPLEEGERFRLIVSNPPYVPTGDLDFLQEEIRAWEPRGALVAGPQGMDVLSPLVRQAPAWLEPGGLLALEVGDQQAPEVVGIMEEVGAYRTFRIRPDLGGGQRYVLGVASKGR